MRIMLDTNILLSVAAFRSHELSNMLCYICENHELLLSTYVINECYEVVKRKKPSLISALDRFIEALPCEIVYTPQTLPVHELFTIRDVDDEKVLYSAIISNSDIFITGDKDFEDIIIEKPEILTPRQFIEKYMSNS